MDEREHLKELLNRYKDNLRKLELKAAEYGGYDRAPLPLQNEIDDQREEIEWVEAQLSQLPEEPEKPVKIEEPEEPGKIKEPEKPGRGLLYSHTLGILIGLFVVVVGGVIVAWIIVSALTLTPTPAPSPTSVSQETIRIPGVGVVLPPDSDSDGLLDHVDRCPTEYGLLDNRGCPSYTPTNTPGTPTPDAAAMETVIAQRVIATLTAQAPKPIDTPTPTPTALLDQIKIKEVIPSTWQPQELREVDLDDDDEEEWLLIYHQTSVPNRPLGGVIYDVHDASPIQPHLKLPPAYLVPYRLLPDLEPGKGQGYLGETGYGIETYDTDGDGKQDELVILGYSREPNPTQVAFFRWENEEVGYKLTAYFYGDGGVEAVRPRDGNRGRIETVIVKEELHERSWICQKTVYLRKKDDVTYEQVSGPILDFTYGVPSRPFYPEAAVLAYYLALAGGGGSPDDYTTGDGQLSAQNLVKAELGSEARAKKNAVIGLTYPSSISKENVSNIEYANVTVNLIMDDILMEITWQVVNVSFGKLNEEVTWKLDSIISARKLVE